jgi:hypothetical protein
MLTQYFYRVLHLKYLKEEIKVFRLCEVRSWNLFIKMSNIKVFVYITIGVKNKLGKNVMKF